MSRTTTILLWLCLLSLLPSLAFTQTLTGYEYWFDEDFNGKISGSLSGTADEINTFVDASILDVGIHKINVRIKQSDGFYSAITSSLFLKIENGDNNILEYWLDDKIDQKESQPIVNSEVLQEINLDLHDNVKFPIGVHKLNMRVTINGQPSAIYSSSIIKLAEGSISHLEYWLDDKIKDSKTISAKSSNDSTAYLFLDEFDLTNATPGYHRLYCRAVSDSKHMVSAVTMTPILVKPIIGNDAKVIQYTVAVDDETAMTYPIKEPADEVEITHSVDASKLAKGQHSVTMSFYNSSLTCVTDSAHFSVNNLPYKLSTPDPSSFRAADITENGFTATWGKVDGALYYDILVKKVGGAYENPDFDGGSTGTSIEVYGLQPGTSYLFQVRARNDNYSQRSDWSPSIPNEVLTSISESASPDLAIHSNRGFDGSEALILGRTYHYNVWVVNNGNSSWSGSFYLKDGDEDIKGWYSILIPPNTAQALECDYTPKSTGSKALVLYYQTGGKGSGIPVNTSDGACNIMLVQVNPDPTYIDGLKLASSIICPESILLGNKDNISATVVYEGNNSWSGTLYIVDSGITLAYENVTLSQGKKITLNAKNWAPETLGTHQIGVYYKSDEGFNWEFVSDNGYTNPIPVEVLRADAFTDVEFAYITNVTKDLTPSEVTPGSQVFYYFRITDDNGNRLKGLKLAFRCEGSSLMQSIVTSPSGDDGIAVLSIETDGSRSIAARGETVKLSCVALTNEKGESIRFASETSDIEFDLTVHQGSLASQESGFENIEKMKFTLDLGISKKAQLGNYIKFKGGISIPSSITTKFDDNGNFKELALDVKAKAKVSGSVGNFSKKKYANDNDLMAIIPELSLGLYGGYHYNYATGDLRNMFIRFVMHWCDNYVTETDWVLDRAIKCLENWYSSKRDDKETTNWFIGGEVGGSMDILNGIKLPSVFPRATRTPSFVLSELKVGGKADLSFDLNIKKTYGRNRTLNGDATRLKLEGEFDVEAKVGQLIEQAKWWWATPSSNGFFAKRLEEFYKLNKLPKATIKPSVSFKTQELQDENGDIKEISHEMSASKVLEYSLEDINTRWKPIDASVSYIQSASFKLSSSEDWATYVGNTIGSGSNNTQDLQKLYPNLKFSTLIAAPIDMYNFWFNPPVGCLNRFASQVSDPWKYKIKEAFKLEHTLSSEIGMAVSIPVAAWISFNIDAGVNFAIENRPTESYYSFQDQRFFPISIHPTTSVSKTFTWLEYKVAEIMEGVFDDDRVEIETTYKRMQDAYWVGSVQGLKEIVIVPGLPEYHHDNEYVYYGTDDSEETGGGGGGSSSWAPKREGSPRLSHYGLGDFDNDYARYIISSRKPLNSIQKLIVKEMLT